MHSGNDVVSRGRILRNVGWLSGQRVLRLAGGLLVGAWVARHLGPADYGVLTYAVALMTLFGALGSLGMNQVLIRELTLASDRHGELVGTAFVLRLAAGCVLVPGIVGVAVLTGPEDPRMLVVVLLVSLALLFQSAEVIRLYFDSRVESRYGVLASEGAFVAGSLIRVALIVTGASVRAFAGVVLVEAGLTAVGLGAVYLVRTGKLERSWGFSLPLARRLLEQSWPLMVSGLGVVVYMKIDMIMLGGMLGSRPVGVYGAAVRLSEVWYFIPTSIVASVMPGLVALRDTRPAAYRRRYEQVFAILGGLGLGVALPMTLLAGPVVRLVFGPEFEEAGPVLAVHIWASVFVFLGVASTNWMIVEGLTRLPLYRTGLGALVNVALNIALIPQYGVMGAAVATVVGYAVAGVVANVLNRSTWPLLRIQLRSLVLVSLLSELVRRRDSSG